MTPKHITREQWIAALRSGKYAQASGELLSSGGGYCCLGVACKLAGVPARDIFRRAVSTFDFYALDKEGNADHDKGLAYRSLYDDLGLNGAQTSYLAHHNDAGMTFDQIANLLEGKRVGGFRLPK